MACAILIFVTLDISLSVQMVHRLASANADVPKVSPLLISGMYLHSSLVFDHKKIIP